MENKEADRIVVSKPVASRPSSSIIIRPFSNLVAGAIIKGSSPNVGPEMGTGPIKPKTVRFKPTINHVPTPVVSSQVMSYSYLWCMAYFFLDSGVLKLKASEPISG